MKLKNYLTPYPILAGDSDDYVDSYFDVQINSTDDNNQLCLDIKFDLFNDGLKDYIGSKNASYFIHIESQLVCYRNIQSSFDEKMRIEIDLDKVGSEIEVSSFIVAANDIAVFNNSKFNLDYEGLTLNLTKGNVLAIGPSYKVEVDRNKDNLKKLEDIIVVHGFANHNSEFDVNLDGDIISINVSEEVKDLYFARGNGTYLNAVISMMMVPSMIFILNQMRINKEIYNDYRWFKIISKCINEMDIDIDNMDINSSNDKNSIFIIAQKIFHSPLKKGLKELESEGRIDE